MKRHFPVFLLVFGLLFTACGGGSGGSGEHVSANPVVLIQTQFGDIEVELYADTAPATVANFLAYVDSGRYEAGRFHRIVNHENDPGKDVKIDVIQGGRTRVRGGKGDFPPIGIETTDSTGILHKDGVISMARSGPNSATSDFFICIGDQPSLDFGGARNPDGYGFAAFGKVVVGMDVVMKIYERPHDGQRLSPLVPIRNVVRRE